MPLRSFGNHSELFTSTHIKSFFVGGPTMTYTGTKITTNDELPIWKEKLWEIQLSDISSFLTMEGIVFLGSAAATSYAVYPLCCIIYKKLEEKLK